MYKNPFPQLWSDLVLLTLGTLGYWHQNTINVGIQSRSLVWETRVTRLWSFWYMVINFLFCQLSIFSNDKEISSSPLHRHRQAWIQRWKELQQGPDSKRRIAVFNEHLSWTLYLRIWRRVGRGGNLPKESTFAFLKIHTFYTLGLVQTAMADTARQRTEMKRMANILKLWKSTVDLGCSHKLPSRVRAPTQTPTRKACIVCLRYRSVPLCHLSSCWCTQVLYQGNNRQSYISLQ